MTTSSISGTITDPAGKPSPGILCYLDLANTGLFADQYPYHSTSNAAGAISFPNLAPGPYKVRQYKPCLDALGLTQLTPDCSQWPMKGVDVDLSKGGSAVVTFVNQAENLAKPPAPAPIPSVIPTYFVDLAGNNASDGKTIATAWKTPRVVSNANVVLTGGQTFPDPIDFGGSKNAWIGSLDLNKPAALSAKSCTSWSASSENCTLGNVTLTSPDGTGVAGNVRGTNISISNVNLGNLAEGLDYQGVTNLTGTGGKQVGNTQGRCHYFCDVKNIAWTGGTFGPSQKQSPIRFSPPGVVGGFIDGMNVTQKGSGFPIACWAVHSASGVTFKNCTSDSGDFSFGSAGDSGAAAGVTDRVEKCIVSNLTVINAKLEILDVAFGNRYIGGSFTNPTGECISVSCLPDSGNTVDGAQMHSPKHGVKFNSASDLIVKNSTLFSTTKSAPVIDGAFVPANDGGGNKLVDSL